MVTDQGNNALINIYSMSLRLFNVVLNSFNKGVDVMYETGIFMLLVMCIPLFYVFLKEKGL